MEMLDIIENRAAANPSAKETSSGEGAPAARLDPSPAERWGVPASMAIAYVYVRMLVSESDYMAWLAGFAALLCAGAALALRDAPRPRECWAWLGCLWVTLLCGLLGRARAWTDSGLYVLIVHGFGAYWLIARTGRLLANGASSAWLPADLAHGLASAPFGNYLLRLRVLREWNGALRDRRRLSAWTALAAFGAALAALLLLCLSVALLSDADPNFGRLAEGLLRAFRWVDAPLRLIEFALSLPVGAWLYGLVFGLRRERAADADARRARIGAGIAALRRVPAAVWAVLLSLFAVTYLAFIALQGSYLFDGLRSVLPERFTAAEYARRGFFELCGVMAVNFTLLGAVAASAARGLRRCAALKWLAAALLAESGLFAVTAAAKLALYIRRFGFTPLRLQSVWLVGVLLAGVLAALRHLLTGRDATRPWLLFAGVSLALTMLW